MSDAQQERDAVLAEIERRIAECKALEKRNSEHGDHSSAIVWKSAWQAYNELRSTIAAGRHVTNSKGPSNDR